MNLARWIALLLAIALIAVVCTATNSPESDPHGWDGATTSSYSLFSPSGVFGRQYLAFFDQLDRSMSLWAPDASAFVYAGGTTPDGAGIWVQHFDGGDPIRVSRGVAAVWSPVP